MTIAIPISRSESTGAGRPGAGFASCEGDSTGVCRGPPCVVQDLYCRRMRNNKYLKTINTLTISSLCRV